MDTFIHYAMGAAHFAMEDCGPAGHGRQPRAVRGRGRLGDRRPAAHRGHAEALRGRRRQPARHLALLHHRPHRQRGGRQHLDQVRPQGPQPHDGDGLHDGRARGRRGVPDDPVRRRGRRDRRRNRIRDHAARGRRVRRHEGALDPQRRSASRLASLGPGPGRFRHRRGRGPDRPGGAGGGEEARRADLRRARGLRHVGRRVPHRGAVGGRRRARARHAQLPGRRRHRPRAGSTTSTRTARRRRSATRPRRSRSRRSSATTPASSRSPRRSR